MIISGIYLIFNFINGKIYIGNSTDLKQRLWDHNNSLKLNKHINKYLQHSYNKYGKENFEIYIIEFCEKEKLVEREQYWMDKYKSYNKNIGYNIRIKANSNAGIQWSEEIKLKISKANKGRKFTEEHKRNKILAATGLKRSDEAKRNMSLGAQNRRNPKRSSEAKNRMKLAQQKNKAGRKFDKWPHNLGCHCKCEECKEKLRKIMQNNYHKRCGIRVIEQQI